MQKETQKCQVFLLFAKWYQQRGGTNSEKKRFGSKFIEK